MWHSQSRIFYIECAPESLGGLPLSNTSLILIERIEKAIYLIRGEKVMLDRDLAALYGVATKVLKQAVKRNGDRFPSDFMFALDRTEFQNWRSQIVTSKADRKGLRYAHRSWRRPLSCDSVRLESKHLARF